MQKALFYRRERVKNHNSSIFNILDDTNGAVKIIDRNLLLLPHGNFAIELERVERTFEIHGAIAPLARIKNATDW